MKTHPRPSERSAPKAHKTHSTTEIGQYLIQIVLVPWASLRLVAFQKPSFECGMGISTDKLLIGGLIGGCIFL